GIDTYSNCYKFCINRICNCFAKKSVYHNRIRRFGFFKYSRFRYMTTNFILAPILMHMFTAIVLLFFWQKVLIQKIISIVGNSIAFLLCLRLFEMTLSEGYLTLQLGGWQAPFGITFISDTLSAIMVLLTALVSLAVGIYSTASLNVSRIKYGYFFIFHFLIMGLLGAFL